MQSHINPATHLDLHRADAAARQRRAATYRFVHQQDAGRSRRRSLVSGLTAAVLALGIVTGAAAQTIGSQPVEQGYEAGLPDGWFDPSEPTVRVAGVVTDRVDTVDLVPHNVR